MKKVAGGATTFYHYDLNGLLIAETGADGNSLKYYVWLNGQPAAMKVAGSGGAWYYFLDDHLGTPQKLVNGSGNTAWEAAYLPFGDVQIGKADMENNLRFPGQYYDAETGLHYNWHRYYDPATGRYITGDPIGLEGGGNVYVYCLNNPITYIDQEGLLVGQIIGGVIGGAFGIYSAVQGNTSVWKGFFIGAGTGILSTLPIPGVNPFIGGMAMGGIAGFMANAGTQIFIEDNPCNLGFDWESAGKSFAAGVLGGAVGGWGSGAKQTNLIRGPHLDKFKKMPIFTDFGFDVINSFLGGSVAGSSDVWFQLFGDKLPPKDCDCADFLNWS